MNKQQEDFIDKVILPKLIQMAIDCTLPSDMNQLSSGYFEDEAEAYNNSDKVKQLKRIEAAGRILCDLELSVEEQLVLIDKQAEIDDTVSLDAVDDNVVVWEPLVDKFTISQFLEQVD